MPQSTMGAHAALAGMTAVIAAMPEELAPLRRRLQGAHLVSRSRPQIVQGFLEGRSVALTLTGDGAGNARSGAQQLFACTRVERLLAIGVSGALSEALGVGDLVVARAVVREHDGRVLEPASAWVGRASVQLGVRAATEVQSERLVDSAGEKHRLRALAGQGGEPAVVDLESAEYACAAQAAGVPWLSLRAVSDLSDEGLPGLLNRCRDRGGAVRRGRVLGGLLLDPRPLARLLQLRARTVQCGHRLAQAAHAWIVATAAAELDAADGCSSATAAPRIPESEST